MPVPLLTCGVPLTLQTNVAYALPVPQVRVFCGDSTPALEQSNVLDFATKSAVVLTAGAAELSGGFIRATTGTPLILLCRA